MSSRLSSTNSLSDGGFLPRAKPRRVLSAEGRRRRNARNRRRQKRKRQRGRGKEDLSDPHTPSTLSISIAPSEIQHAKELNPVVKEKQQSSPEDILGAIDDILKVVDNDEMINSSPTAVVKTVVDDCSDAETIKQSCNGEVSQLAPLEREKGHHPGPDLDMVPNFRLTRADTAVPQRKSRLNANENNSDVLQSERGPFEGELRSRQKYAGAVPDELLKGGSKAGNRRQTQTPVRDLEPNVSGASLPLRLHRVAPGGNETFNTTLLKRRRVDVEYAFAESMTTPGPVIPLLRPSHPKQQRSKEQLGEAVKGNDGETNIPMGTMEKSKFLEEILDLEKLVDITLPEMDESHVTCGGQAKASVDIYPVQTDSEEKKNSLNVATRQDAVQEAEKNDRNRDEERGAKNSRPGEDLTEVGGTETAKMLDKSQSRKQRTVSSTKKRLRATSSVSAILRFARKQNMLQEGHEVNPKPLANDVVVQEPMRRKKKKKETRPSDAKQMLEENQYNESVLLGFGNDNGAHDMQVEVDHCQISAACPTSPPVVEIDKDKPSRFKTNIPTGLGVAEAGQSEEKVGEKGGGFQLVATEGRTTLLGRDLVGEHILADIEPTMPATKNERDGVSEVKPPQPSGNRNPLLSSTGSRGKLDFEDKRKFYDDMVTLMIDTTVELEFFCKELFRVKSKIRDESPS